MVLHVWIILYGPFLIKYRNSVGYSGEVLMSELGCDAKGNEKYDPEYIFKIQPNCCQENWKIEIE